MPSIFIDGRRIPLEPGGGVKTIPLRKVDFSQTDKTSISLCQKVDPTIIYSNNDIQPTIVTTNNVELSEQTEDMPSVPELVVHLEAEEPKEILPHWRNLPPSEQDDWVNIDESRYQGEKCWALAAASRRGKTHAHEGSHRDDSFDFGFQDGWSILVCADGAGSYRLSRVGAKISCEVAVQNLRNLLKGFSIKGDSSLLIPEEADLLKIKQLLIDTVELAIQSVRNEASQRGIEFDLLSTTLLIAIHHEWLDKSLVASIQVGDGAIAVWHGGNSVSILGKADSGDYACETRFITTKGIDKELESKVFFAIKPGVDAVAVMTDGVADDFFPAETYMPGMFVKVYSELLKEKAEKNLLEWLSYDLRGSFDDRTLVVLHRR